MEDYRINTNYAKALFLLASELHILDAVAEDMRLVYNVCSENRELNVVFKNPVIKVDKKVNIVNELFADKIDKTSLAFLFFVVRKNRSVNLKGISDAFVNMYRKSKNIILTEVLSASELDPQSIQIIRQMVGDLTQKQVELVSSVDNNMIGGFKMEFDNNLYDATIDAKLAKLRREFGANKYESKL